jgi:hypothetical protein
MIWLVLPLVAEMQMYRSKTLQLNNFPNALPTKAKDRVSIIRDLAMPLGNRKMK